MCPKKILIIFLIPLISFAEDFSLAPEQEQLFGMEITNDVPDEVPLIIGKVGENNVPEGFEINDEKIDLEDIIKTSQAATKKEDSDELVFYDYSEDPSVKKDISKMAEKTKISKAVETAINREIKEKKVIPPILDRNQLMAAFMEENPSEIVEEAEVSNAKIVLSGFEAKVDEGVGEKIFDFEFVPDYDNFDSSSDIGTGSIEIKEALNSSMGIIRGSIIKRDFVRIKTDLMFEKKDKFIEVPFISQDNFDSFLEKNNISGAGANVLVDLHESISTVDIESGYEAKIFLSENFKKVSEGKERYVLFFGVTPGNVILRLLSNSKEMAQKIIHVTEGEVYFDSLAFIPGKMESVELFEKNILGKVNTELNIDGKDFKILNSEYMGKNVGINRYEFFRPAIPTGSRKYFELTHQDESLFMGIWNSPKVELPNNDFKSQVLYQLNLKGLLESCLIQTNFTKPVSEFKAYGDGNDGGLDVEVYYLGNDGLIGNEIVENTTKAFILGNLPGMVSGAVKYLDGTKDFFLSPCSQNSYLVEQF